MGEGEGEREQGWGDNLCTQRLTTLSGTLSEGEDKKKQDETVDLISHLNHCDSTAQPAIV